jgi:hypothetical protein
MSDGTALQVARDVLGATDRGYGCVTATDLNDETDMLFRSVPPEPVSFPSRPRVSEDLPREEKKSGGWFSRKKSKERQTDTDYDRERKVSFASSRGGRNSPTGSAQSHGTHHPSLPNPDPERLRAGTPQDFLSLGIAAHEAMKLQESAYCFEQAACFQGGCAVGKCLRTRFTLPTKQTKRLQAC